MQVSMLHRRAEATGRQDTLPFTGQEYNDEGKTRDPNEGCPHVYMVLIQRRTTCVEYAGAGTILAASDGHDVVRRDSTVASNLFIQEACPLDLLEILPYSSYG